MVLSHTATDLFTAITTRFSNQNLALRSSSFLRNLIFSPSDLCLRSSEFNILPTALLSVSVDSVAGIIRAMLRDPNYVFRFLI